MEEVSISKLLFNKFKFYDKELRQNILNIIYRNITKSIGYLYKTSGKLNFKVQIGGKKQKIKLKNNKVFEYYTK